MCFFVLGLPWRHMGWDYWICNIFIFSHWPSILKVSGSLSSSFRDGEEVLYHVVCRILVPQPGIEPMLPTVEVQSPSHPTAREVPLSRSNGLIKMLLAKLSVRVSFKQATERYVLSLRWIYKNHIYGHLMLRKVHEKIWQLTTFGLLILFTEGPEKDKQVT